MKEIFVYINKGLIPGAFALLSLVSLIVGLTGMGEQSMKFVLGSVFTLLISILWLFLVLGVIRTKKAKMISFISLAMSVALLFGIYRSIAERFEFMEEEKMRVNSVVLRLKKIREAQVLYREVYGKYSNNFSELIRFLQNGKYPVIRKTGNEDDSVAVAMGLVKIDTLWMNIWGERFMTDFPVDSLPYVPYSEPMTQFEIAAGELDVDGAMLPVFEVKTQYRAFLGKLYVENGYISPPEDSIIRVGSMTEPTTNGNWKE